MLTKKIDENIYFFERSFFTLIYYFSITQSFTFINKKSEFAGVAELVDAPDLGSGAFGRGGSSPSTRTNENYFK